MPSGDPVDDDSDDYGDFDDPEELEIIDQLLFAHTTAAAAAPAPLVVTDIEDYESPRGVRVLKSLAHGLEAPHSSTQPPVVDLEVLRDFQQSCVETRKPLGRRRREEKEEDVEEKKRQSVEPDNRPPIVRFRKPPKKALSVTDLVSPAWCELQYFYTLSKHGRKRRTPAMKQGTAVHQALEDEIHITIPVDVTTAEDSWGLRIWNIIQGLRTLRNTGRTRELEVWGVVAGELVNGVIDELSYECPDPKYEENLRTKIKTIEADLPEDQKSITDYLLAGGTTAKDDGKSAEEVSAPVTAATTTAAAAVKGTGVEKEALWIYITDVKTRATPTLPTGSSLRPTILQLHLYHHMLDNLARGNFHLSTLTERYKLDAHKTFSDSFLAQLGGSVDGGEGGQDLFAAASSQEEQLRAAQIVSSQDSLDILLRHNNLASLWEFMMDEFHVTFSLSSTATATTTTPFGVAQSSQRNNDVDNDSKTRNDDVSVPTRTRLSPLLTAEYLAPTYKHSSSFAADAADTNRKKKKQSIGHKSFGFNPAFLHSFLRDSLTWWRGEREARGVELPEAWKCRVCDFRDECTWIHERDEAVLRGVKTKQEQDREPEREQEREQEVMVEGNKEEEKKKGRKRKSG